MGCVGNNTNEGVTFELARGAGWGLLPRRSEGGRLVHGGDEAGLCGSGGVDVRDGGLGLFVAGVFVMVSVAGHALRRARYLFVAMLSIPQVGGICEAGGLLAFPMQIASEDSRELSGRRLDLRGVAGDLHAHDGYHAGEDRFGDCAADGRGVACVRECKPVAGAAE